MQRSWKGYTAVTRSPDQVMQILFFDYYDARHDYMERVLSVKYMLQTNNTGNALSISSVHNVTYRNIMLCLWVCIFTYLGLCPTSLHGTPTRALALRQPQVDVFYHLLPRFVHCIRGAAVLSITWHDKLNHNFWECAWISEYVLLTAKMCLKH